MWRRERLAIRVLSRKEALKNSHQKNYGDRGSSTLERFVFRCDARDSAGMTRRPGGYFSCGSARRSAVFGVADGFIMPTT